MQNRIITVFKHICASETRMLLCAAGIGLTMALSFAVVYAIAYAETTQADIASEVVRLHILANSDNEDDQAIKLLVRDGLLPQLSAQLTTAGDKTAVCAALEGELENIEAAAEAILRANGYTYNAQASLSRVYFPTRTYGDIALPAGPYDALRIELGTGEGRNWWCMLFPPLCYVDITQTEVSPALKEDLDALLTPEGAALVTNTNDTNMRIRFKFIELWQECKALWTQ